MKPRLAVLPWLVVVLLLHLAALASASPQHSAPIKKKGLIDALKTGGLSAAELIDLISQRGVNFRVTYDDEQELLDAGASPAVVEAVKKHYRGAAVSQADRTNAANLVKSARALIDAHDINSALPVVNQAVDLDPDNADAYVVRGRIYLANNQAKRAEAEFEIALEIVPANAEARRYLLSAKSLEAGGSPGSLGTNIPAEGHAGFLGFRWRFRTNDAVVIGVLPSGSAARGGLLVDDIVLAMNGLSVKDYQQQYLNSGKLTPGAAVNLQIQRQGQALTLQLVAFPRPLDGDEALNYYGQLIQQYPGNPEGYIYRASVYFQLKNYQPALQDINTFMRLDPGDPTGYFERARIKTALGDAPGAKADQDQAARMMAPPNTPPANTQANTQPNASANTAPAFPERWTLLQVNHIFKITWVQDHIYITGIDVLATGDAEKTTDKKGAVIYKGKWHQRNANGTNSDWNMTLKTVTPERIEGTVYTRIFTGDTVTFIPAR